MKIDAEKLLDRINDLLPPGCPDEPDAYFNWEQADDYAIALYHVKDEVREMIKEQKNDRT